MEESKLKAEGLHPGGWWHAKGDRIVCDLCPRECTLKEGDRGFCFVRQNVGGEMALTTYGKSTGFCIDPIEKKPLNHFYPGSSVLSFGTAGCNLGCQFCQNWEISKSREVEKLSAEASPDAIADAAAKTGCTSVAFTYNDPVIWAEYAIDTAKACRERGIKTVAVTAGYITPEARRPFYDWMDAANVDLKAFTERFYRKLTLSHLEPILDTLKWLKHESDTWFEITNLVIPGENDDADELERMCAWIAENLGPDVPIHFTAYHPDFRMKQPRTPHETLILAREIAARHGIRHAYVGNVHDVERQSTYCGSCGKLVIERDWYTLGRYHLEGDRCGHCGATVPGRFAGSPGTWGRKRLPIDMKPYQKAASEKKSARAASRLDPSQKDAVIRATAEALTAAVGRREACFDDPGLAGAASMPVNGIFVSLKRMGKLRSCRGIHGTDAPLLETLVNAARSTAFEDPRFPPVSPTELPYLECELWILEAAKPVEAVGQERVAAVEIGKHGLVVQAGDRRGLLLPGVAVEMELDAAAFLQQVSLKAGLPAGAWADPGTKLWTFEGLMLEVPLEELAGAPRPAPMSPEAVTSRAARILERLVARIEGRPAPVEDDPVATIPVSGLVMEITGLTENPETRGMVGLRGAIDLEKAIASLIEPLEKQLPVSTVGAPPDFAVNLAILHDMAMHGSGDDPDLRGLEESERAVMAYGIDRFSLLRQQGRPAEELLGEALLEGGFQHPQSAQVYSLAVVSNRPNLSMKSVPSRNLGQPERAPAVAGSFYPAEVAELERTVTKLLHDPKRAAPRAWPMALIPHAALKYSGKIAARTLASMKFPSTILAFCPRHTGQGANWAVSPYQRWNMPGGSIAGAPELARELSNSVPGLQLDAGAHDREHAIEVQLPLLRELAPDSRLVAISIGPSDLPLLLHMAKSLADYLGQIKERPLFLISGDLHHYGTDEENRRLDAIVIETMERMNPARLHAVVTQGGISMCGLMPSVVAMETLRLLGGLRTCQRTGYATTADTTGDKSRVVGYAGMLFR